MPVRVMAAMPLLLLLASCAETEPYQRAGMWQPVGANALNLAAMVQDPADLIRGRGARGSEAKEAGAPVDRLFSGKLTPLPASGTQAGAAGPAAQAPAAGAN